jgi:hypothetical protein
LVLDDASTEYDLHFLESVYPAGTSFARNETPSGSASVAARRLMEAFLSRNESILVILDSDLVVAKNFLAEARTMLPLTDGLLSLFNAHSHPSIEKGPLLVKKSIGFAGSVWTRPIVEEILENVPFTIHFDDAICDFLRATKREILCLRHSAVQHLGLVRGENSKFLTSDYGISFTDTSWYNVSAIQEVFLQGCRGEFQRIDRRHHQSCARHDEEMKRLREEIELLRSAVALYQGDATATPRGTLSLRRRFGASLAKIAFGLLRMAQGRPFRV